jgi:hypothetical protein
MPDSSSRKSPSKVDISNADRVRVGGLFCPTCGASTVRVEPSKSVIYPSNEKVANSTAKSTRREATLLFNFMSASLASTADEILFVKFVQDQGLTQAMQTAARFDLRCLRPLRALLSDSNTGGKSYTKQNGKPRPRRESREVRR